MKRILDKISITTFALVYLFFCGGLYLIAYWSTFDLDITNYISLEDVPKSFLFPTVQAFGIIILIVFAIFCSRTLENKWNEENPTGTKSELVNDVPSPMNWYKFLLSKDEFFAGLFSIILSLAFLVVKDRENLLAVNAMAILILILFITKMITSSVRIKTLVPNYYYRLLVALFICVIPAYVFLTAKINATMIWKNKSYYSVLSIKFKNNEDPDNSLFSFKLLGKLGGDILLSDTLNSKIIILNTESVSSIGYKRIIVDKR